MGDPMRNPKIYLTISILLYVILASAFLLFEFAAASYDWSSFIFFSFVYWMILSLDYQRKFKINEVSN